MKTNSIALKKTDRFEITSQGFLVADANLTRIGVFDYYEDGKLVRELRPPDAVFDKASMDSLRFAPLTDLHPDEMISIDNVQKHAIGLVGENIERRGDFVAGKVVIQDKAKIKEILDKFDKGESIELSMGYDAQVDDISGTDPKDGHFDKTQKEIVYNHASIVPRGRAGRDVKLIMDAEAEFDTKTKPKKKDTEVKTVQFIKGAISKCGFHMDAVNAEVNDDSVGTVEKLSGKIDEAVIVIGTQDEALTTAKTDKEALQAKHDQLVEDNAKLKTANDELTSPDSATLQAIIAARADMETLATTLGVKTEKEDGSKHDSPTLRNAIIAAASADGKFDAEGKEEVYLAARYDAVVGMVASAKKKGDDAKLGSFIVDASKKLEGKTDASATFSEKSAALCKPAE